MKKQNRDVKFPRDLAEISHYFEIGINPEFIFMDKNILSLMPRISGKDLCLAIEYLIKENGEIFQGK